MRIFWVAILSLLVVLAGTASGMTFEYGGSLSMPLTMNGQTISAGTAFSGLLNYDLSQPSVTSNVYSGTETNFRFHYMTLTIKGNTVIGGPGDIALFNDVKSPSGNPRGLPSGDSFYTFSPGRSSPNPSYGSFGSISPNFIYLGYTTPNLEAFTSTDIPSDLELFGGGMGGRAFVGISYGNTTTISPLYYMSLIADDGSHLPEPSTLAFLGLGMVGVLRKRR